MYVEEKEVELIIFSKVFSSNILKAALAVSSVEKSLMLRARATLEYSVRVKTGFALCVLSKTLQFVNAKWSSLVTCR